MEKKVLIEEIVALLNKVNRQAQILGHLPHMARIDVDLLLAQIRQVYDKALDLQTAIEPSRHVSRSEAPVSQIRPEMQQPEIPLTTTPVAEEREAEKSASTFDFDYTKPQSPVPLAAEPIANPAVSTPATAKTEPVSQPFVQNEPLRPIAPQTSPAASPVGSTGPKSVHEAYEAQTEDHSLAAKLQYNPIHDLRSAIGINDKFLLMNELFKGSMEQYNAAIERLNGFYSFEDAEIFLGSLRILHDWPEEGPAIERLVYFVRRRYQKE